MWIIKSISGAQDVRATDKAPIKDAYGMPKAVISKNTMAYPKNGMKNRKRDPKKDKVHHC